MGGSRQAIESPYVQGEDEAIAYPVDTTNFPGTGAITNEADVIKDAEGEDVSATHLTGSVVEAAPIITTRLVSNLVAKVEYRMEVKWDQNGNTFEAWFTITGEE